MWSISSRSLWQHGPSALFLSAMLYCLLKQRFGWAGFWLAASFTMRPSNAVAVVAITAYVFAYRREHALRFLGGASPVAAAFLGYNLLARHALFPMYFIAPGFAGGWHGDWDTLLAQLVSPSRGVLVFTPVFLASVYGIVEAFRRRWLFPLSPFLAGILLVHTGLIAGWMPGHTYGSRYFSDMTPVLVFFLIPAVLQWQSMSGAKRTGASAAFLTLAVNACGLGRAHSRTRSDIRCGADVERNAREC
jgi:hypothetical protein